MQLHRPARSSPSRLPLLPERLGTSPAAGAAAGTRHRRHQLTFQSVLLVGEKKENLFLFIPQRNGVEFNTEPSTGTQTGIFLFSHLFDVNSGSERAQIDPLGASRLSDSTCLSDACCVMEQKDEGGQQIDSPCGVQTQPGQAGLCE